MPRQLQTTAAAAAATATTMTTTCGCDATWNLSQVKSIKCKIAVLRWLLLNLHTANSSSIQDDSNNNNSNSNCCRCNCSRKTSSQRFQLIWLSFKAYQSSKLQIQKITYLDRDPDTPQQWIVQFCKSYDLYHKCSYMSCHPPRTLLAAPAHPHQQRQPCPHHPRDNRNDMWYNVASCTDPPRKSAHSGTAHHCSWLWEGIERD